MKSYYASIDHLMLLGQLSGAESRRPVSQANSRARRGVLELSDADLRNGEWEYGRFGPDGKLSANVNYNACFQCHKPKTESDFVFTLPQLLKFAR